jgi:alkaline phosphatase
MLLSLLSCSTYRQKSEPALVSRNVILIIGDGMGPEQVKAAGFYKYGETGSLSFEKFPYRTEMSTHSLSLLPTDSAASATAMATGHRVFNKVLSLQIPGSKAPMKTILEIAAENGKKTGLVTTAFVTHATPAAFASHINNRKKYDEIGLQYLNLSRPNVLFGGGTESLSLNEAQKAGYKTISDLGELNNLNDRESNYYMGYFGSGYMPYMYDGTGDLPELSDMALKAIDILEEDEDGFFLMIEAGRIDHAGHDNDLIRNIHEVLELSDTVNKVLQWAERRSDTIIIVTADHECGGLHILRNNGAGNLPDATWRLKGHTSRKVPVYLWGDRAEELSESIKNNRDIFKGLVID